MTEAAPIKFSLGELAKLAQQIDACTEVVQVYNIGAGATNRRHHIKEYQAAKEAAKHSVDRIAINGLILRARNKKRVLALLREFRALLNKLIREGAIISGEDLQAVEKYGYAGLLRFVKWVTIVTPQGVHHYYILSKMNTLQREEAFSQLYAERRDPILIELEGAGHAEVRYVANSALLRALREAPHAYVRLGIYYIPVPALGGYVEVGVNEFYGWVYLNGYTPTLPEGCEMTALPKEIIAKLEKLEK